MTDDSADVETTEIGPRDYAEFVGRLWKLWVALAVTVAIAWVTRFELLFGVIAIGVVLYGAKQVREMARSRRFDVAIR